jgi:hypothetical protein
LPLDGCTRRCVAHHCRPDMRGELTPTRLALALWRPPPPPGLLQHSDRGVQYAAIDFQDLTAANGLTLSMSHTANPYDNALAASFVATLNTECFPDAVQPTRAAAELLALDCIEAFYNRRSRRSSLGYRSPIEFENGLQSTPREGCSAGRSKGGETCPEKQVGSSRRKQADRITQNFSIPINEPIPTAQSAPRSKIRTSRGGRAPSWCEQHLAPLGLLRSSLRLCRRARLWQGRNEANTHLP